MRVSRIKRWVGIVGARNRNNLSDLVLCRKAYEEIAEAGDGIVSGGCPLGGDRFARIIAKRFGLPILEYFPEGNKDGKTTKKEYFARNTDIAEQCDILIAVVASNRRGGTEDTITKAENLGKTVILVREKVDFNE